MARKLEHKQKQYIVKNSIKTLKMVHIKKIFKKNVARFSHPGQPVELNLPGPTGAIKISCFGNSSQYSVMTYMGQESKKEWMYVNV